MLNQIYKVSVNLGPPDPNTKVVTELLSPFIIDSSLSQSGFYNDLPS